MTTTDLLTFFQPEESSGKASTFSIQTSDGPAIEVWVFAREKVSLSRFANATVSSDEDRRNLHQELQSLLQPGGGLLIYARPHNDVVRLQMLHFDGSGYTPPKRMLCLSLCGDSRFEDIAGSIDLEIGDHLVLPVSKDAEARLIALRDNLKGLPSDLESSVLNIIRRPSLEWRLDRIERTLSLPPATQADQRRSQVRQGNFLERLHGFVMWRVPIGPVVAAALLLTTGSLFAYNKLFFHASSTTEARAKDPKTPQVAPAPHVPPPPPPAKPKDLEAPVEVLFKSLEASGDPSIHGLYTTHFKDHQQNAFKSPDVSWGITKLKALELGFIDKDHPKFKLNDRLAWSDTEAVYRDQKNLSILNDDKSSVNLLAYIWCQQTKAPALPATSKYKDPLSLKGACGDVNPEDAVPGLEALTTWINKQSETIKMRLHG